MVSMNSKKDLDLTGYRLFFIVNLNFYCKISLTAAAGPSQDFLYTLN
jgi:hypothetical protein